MNEFFDLSFLLLKIYIEGTPDYLIETFGVVNV